MSELTTIRPVWIRPAVGRRRAALAAKRGLDIVGAAVGLLLLGPVLLCVAVVCLLADGRPVLFRQERVGEGGRRFVLTKFRTMIRDAEGQQGALAARNEVRGPGFKITDDPRLTRVGRVLRRASIDELPQLWNVLRGSMSLVGPRPPLPSEVAWYDAWHRRRLAVKPGITGLWQISARREVDFDRWVELDLEYIERWSLWLDVRILARTAAVIVELNGR